MSIRQLRKRLDRLARSAKWKEVKEEERKILFNFPLDPAVVKAMSDDLYQLDRLQGAHVEYWRGPFDPYYPEIRIPDTPEMRAIRERIAERAKTISCPPSYGFKEYWIDYDRPKERPSQSQTAEAEEQEAKVRMEVFRQSPEGRARIRLHELENGPGLRTAAECEEIDRLLKLYPELWFSPKKTKYLTDGKLRIEKHQRWIAESEARERAKLQQENKK